MYDRILVTVDGSPFAESIIPYAAGIAAATGGRLEALRVAHENELPAAEEYVGELGKRGGIAATSVPADGLPAPAILREVEGAPAGLLAMATHGRGGLLETIMGSVASEVLQQAKCPLLLFRPSGDEVDVTERRVITSIVLALDGSEYSERVMLPAASLAKAIGAQIKVVQVISPDARVEGVTSGDVMESSYVRSRAGAIQDEFGVQPDWDVLHGDPAEAISDHVRGMQNAMLAMASHARAPLTKVVLGSVTSACLRRTGLPVLVVGPNYAAQA